MGFVNPILGGGGALVRPAIKSPNYVPGSSGWSVNRTGDAEFNDLTIRGEFDGTNFQMTDQGAFFYNGVPALGNLIAAIAGVAGTDPYGNAFGRVFNAGNQAAAHFGVDSKGVLYIVNASNQAVIQINPTKQGIFYYSGVPAAGNLVGVWAAADGTDPFGNAYIAGLTLFSPVGRVFLGGLDGVITSTGSSGSVINVEDGQISFTNTASPNPALIIQDLDRVHGSLYLAGGSQGGTDRPARLGIVTSYGAPTTGSQDTYPRTSTADYAGSGLAHHYVTGALIKANPTGDIGEIWHVVGNASQPAYAANFAAASTAGTYQSLQYRLDGEDNLRIEGAWHCTAALSSALVFTLPAGYRPLIARGRGATSDTSAGAVVAASTFVQVNSDGRVVLHLSAASAISQNFYVDATIPLGNIT